MGKTMVDDQAILALLDTLGGYTTGDIAKRIPRNRMHSPQQHSAAVRARLLAMEKEGIVARLDDQKPVCWKLKQLANECGIESSPGHEAKPATASKSCDGNVQLLHNPA